MNGLKTKEYIEKVCKEKDISYLDVRLYKGYEELFSYGVAKGGKPTGKERLYMFSATKPMTVTCAMRLVEEGKLGLDDPVEKYLPAYANTFLLDENGKEVPTKNKMLVRHLFTMSGGLTYDVRTQPIQDLMAEYGGKADTVTMVGAFVKTPLSFEPGTRFQYSLCHDVLAAVVEKASGKRFAEYMKEIIFEPLGMEDSGFHTENKGIYDMYFCEESGEMTPMERDNFLVLGENYDSGGAGLISNVDDYVKFAVALANDGRADNGYQMLQAETVAKIREGAHGEMQVQNSFTCVQGGEYDYGLGVRVRRVDTPWGLKKGEFGWDGAAGTYLLVDPHKNISVVVGMHIRNWPVTFRGEHLKLVQFLYEDMKKENLW